MTDPEWEILDRKALRSIFLCPKTLVAFNISKDKTMIGLMTALNKLYEKPSASNKVFLMKRLFNLKMVEGGL
jgi:acyl-activating enzyme 14